VKHFKNLIPHGLPVWLLPIMIVVEILGMFSRPFALCIRLFANMTAGHVVIISLISIIFIFKSVLMAFVSVPFVLFIDVLEILVAFIQAFIFTMLTALFIGMAVQPAH
jgi:F-type H+-transporting ATPase subunit a